MDQVIPEEVNTEAEEVEVEEPEEGQSAEETPQSVSIGGKEYTLDELQKIQEKANQYEQLLPDYTRKAQRLSELESDKKEDKQLPEEPAPYEKEDWVPQDYKELAQAIKQAEERGMNRAVKYLETQKKAELDAKQAVDSFVDGVRTKDKDFDEQDFFDYAVRHKFPVKTVDDLNAVYSAYAEVSKPKAPKTGSKPKVAKPSTGGSPQNQQPEIRSTNIFDRAMEAFDKYK